MAGGCQPPLPGAQADSDADSLAARLLRGNAGLLDWAGIGLRMAGGLVIAFLGTILFLGSLGSTNAMM